QKPQTPNHRSRSTSNLRPDVNRTGSAIVKRRESPRWGGIRMGLFTRNKHQQGSAANRTPPMPPGRRLRSNMSPEDCVEVLRQIFDGYRPRRRPDMEPLVPTGIRWAAEDGAPSI